MSADSPRGRSSRGSRPGAPGSGQLVTPQPVNDRSIIDSVAGFINDVVPQAYTSSLPGENKENVLWAHFESADINDPSLIGDGVTDSALPLLLVLGYTSGVQVWSVAGNGEASELISWSQGNVKTFRFLPTPASNTLRSPDAFSNKRPLVALCDSAGPGPPYCSVNFISLRCGDQVKSIKFKNQVCDILANRRWVVVTFNERIAVFDACTLEDRLSVTTCYPSPGPNPNPVALGSRWLAYAEKKLISWQRSSGGAAGVGSQSYTATVLHAAQTLGRGLRGLSETVASSLTGPRGGLSGSAVNGSPPMQNGTDHHTPGVVTILDLEGSARRSGAEENSLLADSFVSHFIAHTEAIVAMAFDPSGLLFLTADRRGHDFHVFRLQPHPGGASLSAAHHLYVLHRGDTTAKVQDIAFSCDSRWVAVSTMRGTTHVFPLTPYGGPVGVRTHDSPHVVNRLSRFHRSAGLSADGRSSPVPSPESLPSLPSGPHANPRMPPYPHPTVQSPLAQLRQPHHPALAPSGALDVSLRVCANFGAPRAWLLEGARENNRLTRRAVDSLFVMACHGSLLQYDLEPKPVSAVPREKVCGDTPIELDVEERAQWTLQRSPQATEIAPPLSPGSVLLNNVNVPSSPNNPSAERITQPAEDRWLSQVEIVTHAGPHRRLWMGPQITFKTLAATGSTPVGIVDCEIDTARGYVCRPGSPLSSRPARSEPVNMPASSRPVVPVLIESGSSSSYEQPPYLVNISGDLGDDAWVGPGESRLREDLADAMLESPGAAHREKGQRRYRGSVVGGGEGSLGNGDCGFARGKDAGAATNAGPVRRVVNPGGVELAMSSDGEEEPTLPEEHTLRESVTTIAAAQLLRRTSATASDIDPAVSTPIPQVLRIAAVIPAPANPTPPTPLPRSSSDRMDVDSSASPPSEELKEEPPLAAPAPKRSWSCIVSVSAKNKSQKTKKSSNALEPETVSAGETSKEEEEKIPKGRKKINKSGNKPKATIVERSSPERPVEKENKRSESPEKPEEERRDWEESEEPREEELEQQNEVEELCGGEHIERLLIEEELEADRHEEEMREVILRGDSAEEAVDSDDDGALLLDELDVRRQADDAETKRSDGLTLSTYDDNEYVEAEPLDLPYYCYPDDSEETIIEALEACESFYHDAHKAMPHETRDDGEKCKALAEAVLESTSEDLHGCEPTRDDDDPGPCVAADVVDLNYANPAVGALSAAPDTLKRNRRQKKKRR